MKFLKQVQAEMSKVVWPSRQKTIFYTIVVILISLFVAYYMAGFDFIFLKYGIKSLIS